MAFFVEKQEVLDDNYKNGFELGFELGFGLGYKEAASTFSEFTIDDDRIIKSLIQKYKLLEDGIGERHFKKLNQDLIWFCMW